MQFISEAVGPSRVLLSAVFVAGTGAARGAGLPVSPGCRGDPQVLSLPCSSRPWRFCLPGCGDGGMPSHVAGGPAWAGAEVTPMMTPQASAPSLRAGLSSPASCSRSPASLASLPAGGAPWTQRAGRAPAAPPARAAARVSLSGESGNAARSPGCTPSSPGSLSSAAWGPGPCQRPFRAPRLCSVGSGGGYI